MWTVYQPYSLMYMSPARPPAQDGFPWTYHEQAWGEWGESELLPWLSTCATVTPGTREWDSPRSKEARPVPKTAGRSVKPLGIVRNPGPYFEFSGTRMEAKTHLPELTSDGKTWAGVWDTYKLNTHQNVCALMPCSRNHRMLKIKAFLGRMGREGSRIGQNCF